MNIRAEIFYLNARIDIEKANIEKSRLAIKKCKALAIKKNRELYSKLEILRILELRRI